MNGSTPQDLAWRLNRAGSMAIVTTPGEYVCNIVQRLFYTVPGTDEYNKDMGLDIIARSHRTYIEGSRDTEYEQLILTQFNTYTDIVPTNVVAIYHNSLLIVAMSVSYNNIEYQLQISSDPNTLTAQIVPKTV